MNAVSIELQKEHLSLSECRLAVDSLLECVKNGRDIVGNPFYRTEFTGCYVYNNARLSTDEHFESGVVKIQRGAPHSLTDEERESCKGLLVQSRNTGSNSVEDQSLNPVLDLMREKRQKLKQNDGQYINPDFCC